MLYYDRIDICKGIDPAKSKISKECMISHYLFFNHGFKFQDSVSVNINDIAIITVKNVDYRCIMHNISKSEAIGLLESAVLEKPEFI